MLNDIVSSHLNVNEKIDNEGLNQIVNYYNENIVKNDIEAYILEGKTPDEIIDYLLLDLINNFENRTKEIPEEIKNDFEKAIYLRVIDMHWLSHINNMDNLREGIFLRGYANENPYRAYANEGFNMFNELEMNIDRDLTLFLMRAEVRQNVEAKPVKNIKTNTDNNKVKNVTKKSEKVGRNSVCPWG